MASDTCEGAEIDESHQFPKSKMNNSDDLERMREFDSKTASKKIDRVLPELAARTNWEWNGKGKNNPKTGATELFDCPQAMPFAICWRRRIFLRMNSNQPLILTQKYVLVAIPCIWRLQRCRFVRELSEWFYETKGPEPKRPHQTAGSFQSVNNCTLLMETNFLSKICVASIIRSAKRSKISLRSTLQN